LLVDGILDKRWGRAIGRVVRQHWLVALVSMVVAVAVAIWSCLGGVFIAFLTGGLLGLIGVVVAITVAFASHAMALLPELNFGLCPGRTQPGQKQPALSDWLARTIEDCAGRLAANGGLPERPLTFGDLETHSPPIRLRAMTTNLGLRRPHTLPDLGSRNFFFRVEDFSRLFSDWVVKAMIGDAEERNGFYPFPAPEKLPVVVAVRMSLSFPLLISAVPLYRRDFADNEGGQSMEMMLFSDGGLSSNFPIHLFDSVLPSRPTFGIALDEYVEPADGSPDRRVRLPMKLASGRWQNSRAYTSVPSFLMGLLDAAKDWQDNLQAEMIGYRERIAHVYLKDDEGGLNLTMPADRINELVEFGERAGTLLVGDVPQRPEDRFPFDFDEHRWRRFLMAYAAIEEALTAAADDWGHVGQAGSFAAFIDAYKANPGSYNHSSMKWRQEAFNRMDELMALGRTWQSQPLRHTTKAVPRSQPRLKIAPRF
ncbi:MAG: patatin-like phospholipase family protein, partial [Magnetospirillum sp.]